jgi:S-formylglutathione hydrolase
MGNRSKRQRIVLVLLISALWIRVPTAFAGGKLVNGKVVSPSLKGNLLGDQEEQPFSIYLPPSYQTAPAKRFSTVYLLHGFTGNIQQWTVNGYQGMDLCRMMDDLIASHTIREMIVVVPNGGNAYFGSFYTNSVATGNWEDYVCRDLISYVDRNYRTNPHPASRGIAGHSMGGFGSILLGMKHPDVFSALYALSPACLSLESDLGVTNRAWLKAFQIKSRDEIKGEPKTLDEFYVRVFVALSAALSPDPKRTPLYVCFPFRQVDGRLVPNEPAYGEWHAKMPLYLVERYNENLHKLRGIHVEVGQNDEFPHIRLGSARFSSELAKRDVPHIFEIYAGGDHGNMIRERVEKKVLPFFSRTLEFSP